MPTTLEIRREVVELSDTKVIAEKLGLTEFESTVLHKIVDRAMCVDNDGNFKFCRTKLYRKIAMLHAAGEGVDFAAAFNARTTELYAWCGYVFIKYDELQHKHAGYDLPFDQQHYIAGSFKLQIPGEEDAEETA